MSSEIALVVGAAGLLGQTIVEALVGADLIVIGIGRNAAALDRLAGQHGDAMRPCVADIGEDAAVATIAALIDRPVAMLVHGPGVPVAGGVLSAPTEAIVAACNIKVAGMVRLVRAADRHLRSGSRLVAIGGHYGSEPSPYAATAGVANAALANLVRQLSWAYGERGITAHLVAPGPVDSERLRRVASDRAARNRCSPDEELATMQSESPLGVFTTAAQVAWAVRLLLAPEADALAGSTLALDSGRRRGIG